MVLAIYGASGLGCEFQELASDINAHSPRWNEMVFVDDDNEKVNTCLVGCQVISFNDVLAKYERNEVEFILAIGEPEVKNIVYQKVKEHGYSLTTLVHPTSTIAGTVELGEGVVIQSWNRIPQLAKIGNNVLIQGMTNLGHAVVFEDNVVISSGVFIGGATQVGKNTYIAPHACLRNGIIIGEDVVIGMGSVVTKNIPDRAVAYGNPCEVKRINEKGRVFSK